MATKIRVNLGNGAYAEFPDLVSVPVEMQGFPYEVIEITGPTPEEIAAEKTPIYTERIMSNVTALMTRALISSMGKDGSRIDLESIKKLRDEKYHVSKGNKVNSTMLRAITDEFSRDYPTGEELDALLVSHGLTPTGNRAKKVSDFIIHKHESESNLYDIFISFIEDFRACASSHVSNWDFEKADIVIAMVEGLSPAATLPLLETKRAEMLAV
jgi:hypothetical protein